MTANPNLWHGKDRVIELRDIRIHGRGIVLNDPNFADHNCRIFEKFNRRIREFRLELYERDKINAACTLALDLDVGHGMIYLAPDGVKFEYAGGIPSPYDIQNLIELRGSIAFAPVDSTAWFGRPMVRVEGARVNQLGTLLVWNSNSKSDRCPSHGVLFRQGWDKEAQRDRQPWGRYGMVSVNGHFTDAAVEAVSAEEIIFNYLIANSLQDNVPAFKVAITSPYRLPETMQTMTNLHVSYGHLSTLSGPVVIFDGFIGGQISLDAGVLHVKTAASHGHVRFNRGAHLRTLRYGMRHDRGPRASSGLSGVDFSQGTLERFIDMGFTHHDTGAALVGTLKPGS